MLNTVRVLPTSNSKIILTHDDDDTMSRPSYYSAITMLLLYYLLFLLSIPSTIALLIPQPAGLSAETILSLAQKRYSTTNDDKLPMHGKTVVITGAAGGIGQELTRITYNLGATVFCMDRNADGLNELQHELLGGDTSTGRIIPLLTMHEDLASVASSARQILDSVTEIDLLINNAGMTYQSEPQLSKTGNDLAFTVNYLSHMLLAEMLVPKILAGGRVVQVTSSYHWKIDGSELVPGGDTAPLAYQGDRTKQSLKHVERSYGNTKMAQLWHAQVLAEKYKNVHAVCACPTWVGTGIGGEDARSFLETFAFSVKKGPGITSVLNAMLRTDEELGVDALCGKCLVANSRILEYVPFKNMFLTSTWATESGWRDIMGDLIGFILLIGQRFTHEDFILQKGSPESTGNQQGMNALYEWSLAETMEFYLLS
jgi:NAD(P)-dependent dehydrogenase (short-subunit alcohol dehydrogenase family)